MAYGVTAQGFVGKPLDVIKSELEALFRSVFGADVNLDPREPLGQIIGIVVERHAEVWELAEDVYRAADPDANAGDAQDAIAAISGTLRAPATKSTVDATLSGTPGTVVPAGSVASVSGAGSRFVLSATVTIGGGGTVTGTFEAEETGPVAALAGTLTVIETPVAGWTAVTNPLDATLGTDLETDAALRVRREDELRATGAAALDAIRADVLAVPGVTACTVFENTTGTTDPDGIPPKAIEVMVSGGADQAIRDAIWATKAAGIETHGGVSGTVLDSQGLSHMVKLSRPTELLVYLDVYLRKDSSYPVDGDAQVKAQLAAKTYAAGDDVVAWALKKLVTVAGVYDVPTIYVGLVAWPTSEATLVVAPRELAKLDSSRVRVTQVP
jgi:uncharacterized phage protein gp47/JayE